MDYVEFRRVRRVLTVYAIVLAIGAILVVASIHAASVQTNHGHFTTTVRTTVRLDAPAHRHSAHEAMQQLSTPLGLILGIAGYIAVTFATILASSLNKENDGANFVFTKPISRERLALQYMAIDAAGILSAFALACGAIFGAVAALGFMSRIYGDTQALWIGALGLGIAFMWYGIMQAVTASYRGKGGALVGWSWAVFGVLGFAQSATYLGPIVGAVVRVINLFNPIAYFSGLVSSGRAASAQSVLGLALEPRVAIAWCIALVGCALAIRIWKRVEI